MPGSVLAAQVRRLAYAFKAVDLNIWGAKIDRADTSVETQAYHILVMHRVVEPSHVMIHPKQELIRQPRSYCAVQNTRPVLNSGAVGPKICGVDRIEISGSLATSHKTSDSQPLLRSESVVHSRNTIVAHRIIVGASAKVARCRGCIPDRTRPKIAQQVEHHRVHRNVVGMHDRFGFCYPRV